MNIYVSHLSWGTSSEGLGNLFMQFGEVASANVITDRETGRSRGFGFVEMPNEEEGQKAIDQLNGTSFEGQTITVLSLIHIYSATIAEASSGSSPMYSKLRPFCELR